MNAPKRLKVRQRLNVPTDFDITDIIPIFHRWIREQAVPGLLIDVADYKHVPNGPGIFLIGDEGDYSLEEVDEQFYFVYDRKRQTGADLENSIRILLTTVRSAIQSLEAEPSAELAAADENIEIIILDRLQYPNSFETFDAIRGSLSASVSATYELRSIQLGYAATDTRRPLSVQVQTAVELVPA